MRKRPIYVKRATQPGGVTVLKAGSVNEDIVKEKLLRQHKVVLEEGESIELGDEGIDKVGVHRGNIILRGGKVPIVINVTKR